MALEITADKARQMSLDEIRYRLEKLREDQFNLRFRHAMRQLDNPLKVREARREVAILKTVLREHELGIRSVAGSED